MLEAVEILKGKHQRSPTGPNVLTEQLVSSRHAELYSRNVAGKLVLQTNHKKIIKIIAKFQVQWGVLKEHFTLVIECVGSTEQPKPKISNILCIRDRHAETIYNRL